MKSKAGNKLKKIRKLALLASALALTDCITEPKTIAEDHEVSCPSQPDSTTWTDTTEADHFTCHYDPSVNPMPPGPQ